MKNTIDKTCKNCRHWQDIHKTQEVQAGTLPAVIFKTGLCTDGSYTTEKYSCDKWQLGI
jgi:hypothetical protein